MEPDPEEKECDYCPKPARPARVAIVTVRTERAIITKVYWDDRTAPAKASRYCKIHGVSTLLALGETLIDNE
jgi:hypothetical protein